MERVAEGQENTNKPFVEIAIPRSVAPRHLVFGTGAWRSTVEYIAEQIPESSPLKLAFDELARYRPGLTYSFRGIVRLKDLDVPYYDSLPESTLRKAKENIENHGMEKPLSTSDRSYYYYASGDPVFAMPYAFPADHENEIGLIIVTERLFASDQDFIYTRAVDESTKKAHVGTIQIEVV